MEAEEFLTTMEVANRLCLSRSTIARWAKEKRIPFYRVGRNCLRFKISELEEKMRNRRDEKNLIGNANGL